MPHRSTITLVLLVALAVVAGASTLSPRTQRILAQDNPPQVIASFSILADIAGRVAGDAATVTSLMPLGANPHTYTASAQDVARLSDADQVLVVGADYEQSLLPVLEEAAGNRVTVVSQCVPIRPVATGEPQDPVAQVAEHDQAAGSDEWADRCAAHQATLEAAFGERASASGAVLGPLHALPCGGHDEASHDEESDTEHPAGSCDPHVWTDPTNAALWALMIRDALSALDPDRSETYAANTDDYLSELAALDQELVALIETIPAERRAIVTNHVALTYFAERYGLALVGVIIPGGSTTSEPSVRDVLALVETLQAHGVPAVFTETTSSDATAVQIAAEAGVEIVPLYTGSLSQPDEGAGTYLDYIRFNAAAIADALG